nr:MAG TPA: hypothetical protein [Caudoviricetes sp.]
MQAYIYMLAPCTKVRIRFELCKYLIINIST